jgi:hypothetical protein
MLTSCMNVSFKLTGSLHNNASRVEEFQAYTVYPVATPLAPYVRVTLSSAGRKCTSCREFRHRDGCAALNIQLQLTRMPALPRCWLAAQTSSIVVYQLYNSPTSASSFEQRCLLPNNYVQTVLLAATNSTLLHRNLDGMCSNLL